MTMRAYIHRWWANDPNVVPCRLCGCPIQASQGRMSTAMGAHYAVVHPEATFNESETAR